MKLKSTRGSLVFVPSAPQPRAARIENLSAENAEPPLHYT